MEVNFQKIFWKFAHLREVGSVLSSPPATGSTSKFCVCVGHNVAKRHNFLKIHDISTFRRHVADMSPTCTTKKKNLGSRGKQGQGREKEIHMIDAFPFHNF